MFNFLSQCALLSYAGYLSYYLFGWYTIYAENGHQTYQMTLLMKLYKQRVYRDVLKYSFSNRVIDQWNNLPEKVINATSINMFKNRLNKYWATKLGE